MSSASTVRRAVIQAVGLLAAVLASSSVHAAHRCVDAAGRVSFQDTPCPQASKAEEFALRENTLPNGLGRRAAPAVLRFGDDTSANLVTALGALEVLAASGQDCKIELQVRAESRRAWRTCQLYVEQRKHWWEPALRQMALIARDQRLPATDAARVRKGLSYAERIQEHDAFIVLRMGASP